MADIVDDFLQRLAQHVPDVAPEVRLQLECSIRHTWGGTEPYVGKRLSRVTRTSLVAHGLQRQRPMAEVFAQAGVGRATGYRLLQRK